MATRVSSSADDPISAVGLAVASFTNKVLIGHACSVLRRQVQIHKDAKKAHLTPFSLVPVTCQLISKDGILTLWKGSVGSGVLWAMSHLAELVIADLFSLPKTIVQDGSRERFWRHVLLKASSYFAMTPFIVSSFVESVRTGTDIDTRLFEVVFRGFDRLRFDLFGTKDSTKRISILYLSIPTVVHYTSHFLVAKFAYDAVYGMARRYVSRKSPEDRTRFHAIMPEMFASMMSGLVADLACYPLETVLHRLYIQGTRTLIDNLDSGIGAVHIQYKYDGFFHCLHSIINKEGPRTLYNGVGAVILQYSLQFCVLNVLRAIFGWIHGSKRALKGRTSPMSLRKNSSGFLLSEYGGNNISDPPMSYQQRHASGSDPLKPMSSALFPATFAQTQSEYVSTPGYQSGNSFAVGPASPPSYSSKVRQRPHAAEEGQYQPMFPDI